MDKDTRGQGHTWTETLVDRDTNGQGLGYRRTGTVTQTGSQMGRDTDIQDEGEGHRRTD